MSTYIICKNQQDRKVPLEVCQTKCKAQWDCEPFNKMMFDKNMEEQAEKPVEGMMIGDPEEKNDDTDVRREIIERPPMVPSDGKAQQLYQRALSLKAEIEVRWFELGKILEEIKKGRHYIDLGYTTWKDFCEVALAPLELRWRAVDYLITTTMKCEEVGIKKEVAGQIGWTKLSQMVPVLTKENKNEWIKKAQRKGVTVQILNTQVRIAQGKITEKEAEILPEKMFFSLFKEQKENVERTLELAYRMTGSDKRGNQLEMVCAEFRGTYESEDGEFSKKKIVSDLLNRIGVVIRVKFVGEVIDVETGEILVEARE